MITEYAALAASVRAAAKRRGVRVEGRPMGVSRGALFNALGVTSNAFWRLCADPVGHGCDAGHLARWRAAVAEWLAPLPPPRAPGRPPGRAVRPYRKRARPDVDEAAHARAEMAR
jgi:hypothetical protein